MAAYIIIELYTIKLMRCHYAMLCVYSIIKINTENKTLTFKYTNWYKAKTNSYKDILKAMLQLYATYVICTTKTKVLELWSLIKDNITMANGKCMP